MKIICMSKIFFVAVSLLFCAENCAMNWASRNSASSDDSFIIQFSPSMQTVINAIIEMKVSLILQKSEFELISKNVKITPEDSAQAASALTAMELHITKAEDRLKSEIAQQVKASEESYYSTIVNRIKNFFNGLLGYRYTEIERYISRRAIEGLRQSIKELVEKREELLFRVKNNEELELYKDVRTCNALIEGINSGIYELQSIPGRVMSAVKNTFWKS